LSYSDLEFQFSDVSVRDLLHYNFIAVLVGSNKKCRNIANHSDALTKIPQVYNDTKNTLTH